LTPQGAKERAAQKAAPSLERQALTRNAAAATRPRGRGPDKRPRRAVSLSGGRDSPTPGRFSAPRHRI